MNRAVILRTWMAVGGGLGLALLSGCATTECDPAQGGYLRGIGCSASGSYTQREAEKRTLAEQERQRQAELQSDYQRTQAEQAAVRKDRQAAEKKYAALRSELDGLRKKLKQSKSTHQKLEGEIENLKRQTDLLEKDTFTPSDQKAQRLNELQRQKESLERQVELAVGR